MLKCCFLQIDPMYMLLRNKDGLPNFSIHHLLYQIYIYEVSTALTRKEGPFWQRTTISHFHTFVNFCIHIVALAHAPHKYRHTTDDRQSAHAVVASERTAHPENTRRNAHSIYSADARQNAALHELNNNSNFHAFLTTREYMHAHRYIYL